MQCLNLTTPTKITRRRSRCQAIPPLPPPGILTLGSSERPPIAYGFSERPDHKAETIMRASSPARLLHDSSTTLQLQRLTSEEAPPKRRVAPLTAPPGGDTCRRKDGGPGPRNPLQTSSSHLSPGKRCGATA
eukprot:scaffold26723_cov66-Phaeocystis_antarctica.AAC.1